MNNKVIAIDGPSASGKSTVAKRVGAQLGYLYVDSGSLYRMLTWKALLENLNLGDESAIIEMIDNSEIQFFAQNGAVVFTVDGTMPNEELRTTSVDESVSTVAAYPSVRSKVLEWLRNMMELGSLVMEGRDIGSVVFPDAKHKFYLNASAEERARRRKIDKESLNENASVSDVEDALKKRDQKDSNRKTAPLKIAEDARVIDSTNMDIDGVVKVILDSLA